MELSAIQPYQPLLLWGFIFVLSHFAISSTPLRAMLVKLIGEKPYLGLYSLMSLVFIVLFVRAYNVTIQPDLGWMNQIPLHWLAIILMPFVFILFVAGAIGPNPSIAGVPVSPPFEVFGIFRITRHPVLWSFVLFSLIHIMAAGDVATAIFFVFIAFLAGYGTVLIDRKKARASGIYWQDFASETSNIPFAAIITGRQKLALTEIGWMPVLISLILVVVVYVGHLLIPIGTILINPFV